MTALTPEQLDQLEAIAKAATPGPWRVEVGNFNKRGTILTSAPEGESWTSPNHTPIACSHLFSERHAEDWTHIAATSPDVVLALVAAAKELAVYRNEDAVDIMRLNAAMLKAEAERDQLRDQLSRFISKTETLLADLNTNAGTFQSAGRSLSIELRSILRELTSGVTEIKEHDV